MIARGNKCETRWPGLISSVADGSTYSAPVVETGSSFHSSRITNATSSPLSWAFSPIVAHAVQIGLRGRPLAPARILTTTNGGRREGERSSLDPGDSPGLTADPARSG